MSRSEIRDKSKKGRGNSMCKAFFTKELGESEGQKED